jgi:hypothetical protein
LRRRVNLGKPVVLHHRADIAARSSNRNGKLSPNAYRSARSTITTVTTGSLIKTLPKTGESFDLNQWSMRIRPTSSDTTIRRYGFLT